MSAAVVDGELVPVIGQLALEPLGGGADAPERPATRREIRLEDVGRSPGPLLQALSEPVQSGSDEFRSVEVLPRAILQHLQSGTEVLERDPPPARVGVVGGVRGVAGVPRGGRGAPGTSGRGRRGGGRLRVLHAVQELLELVAHGLSAGQGVRRRSGHGLVAGLSRFGV